MIIDNNGFSTLIYLYPQLSKFYYTKENDEKVSIEQNEYESNTCSLRMRRRSYFRMHATIINS